MGAPMLTRDGFEGLALVPRTAAKLGFTGAGIEGPEAAKEAMSALAADGFQDEVRELALAVDRLRADPALRSTDHNGVFTYEDPILANAALGARLHLAKAARSLSFQPGEELTSSVRWMLMGVRAFLSRHRFDPVLTDLASKTPQGPLKVAANPLRIAVVGDAGQAGYAQDRVLKMIGSRQREHSFDAVVHLGDVYFAAGVEEMTVNFLSPFAALRSPTCPVFTLCGNHDLYYGAMAYYHALRILGQPGRYFTIENDTWRIACLDTVLGAATFLRNDGHLDDGQWQWLQQLLALDDNKRLVLLSHHFIISGWDAPAATLRHRLSEAVKGKIFAWYWGHEHRAAVYDRGDHGFYGASLGNGAFPDDWSAPSRSPSPAWYSMSRCSCFGPSGYWPHGYAELEFHPDRIIEVIHLENGERLESELTDKGSTRVPRLHQ
jgi:calcineurin-like phosphoesterase family protein